MTHEVRVDILKRTWEIVDRFIVFLQNEEKPLDQTYPEL